MSATGLGRTWRPRSNLWKDSGQRLQSAADDRTLEDAVVTLRRRATRRNRTSTRPGCAGRHAVISKGSNSFVRPMGMLYAPNPARSEPEVPMLVLALLVLAAPLDSAVIRDIEVAPGETLRVTTLGAGQPVVLIPGIFGSAFSYRTITRPLAARGYQTVVIDPLGYGRSSHPKHADYSFAAQTDRVGRALDQLGVTRALFIAQSTGAAIAFRLAIARPALVRGLLSIDGGPAETAATPGLRKAFSHGSFLAKLVFDDSMLRSQVRQEIVRNSGDTTWVTDAVIREYTAGQTADMHGALDALEQMAKSREPTSLADRLHDCAAPVRLLVGTVPHPAGIGRDERELLAAKLPNFKIDSVAGAGQYIPEEKPAAVLAAVTRLDQASAGARSRLSSVR